MAAQASDISEEEQERTTSDKAEHQFTRRTGVHSEGGTDGCAVQNRLSNILTNIIFEYANQYFELINKEFPEDADSHLLSFWLTVIYHLAGIQLRSCTIWLKSDKEIPDMYASSWEPAIPY